MIVEHGHKRLPATGFEQRSVAVPEGTRQVDYVIPTYDEQVTLGCQQCMEMGARGLRRDLRTPIAEYVALAILELPNGGGKSYAEARAIGEKVAALALTEEHPDDV